MLDDSRLKKSALIVYADISQETTIHYYDKLEKAVIMDVASYNMIANYSKDSFSQYKEG